MEMQETLKNIGNATCKKKTNAKAINFKKNATCIKKKNTINISKIYKLQETFK